MSDTNSPFTAEQESILRVVDQMICERRLASPPLNVEFIRSFDSSKPDWIRVLRTCGEWCICLIKYGWSTARLVAIPVSLFGAGNFYGEIVSPGTIPDRDEIVRAARQVINGAAEYLYTEGPQGPHPSDFAHNDAWRGDIGPQGYSFVPNTNFISSADLSSHAFEDGGPYIPGDQPRREPLPYGPKPFYPSPPPPPAITGNQGPTGPTGIA